MLTEYLFVFAQVHDEFRIPELLSVAEIHGFEIKFSENPKDRKTVARPFMVLELESEEHARLLAQRCVLIRYVCEFYARGKTYEEMHQQNRIRAPQWEKYAADTSFKFLVTAFNHTIPQRRQTEVVESFDYMDWQGKIDMKHAEVTLFCLEEYRDKHGTTRPRDEGDGDFEEVWFGRLITDGTARPLIHKFDVKKRVYYGNTSMEAEMSLLMATQALAAPGKLVYDPFAGTGSMAYTSAYFGAYFYGSDIDGRQMRGKSEGAAQTLPSHLLNHFAANQPGIIRAAAQYGVANRIMDLGTFDVTQNPWRCGELFDAIITDPPYGVRAGAKRLGRKNPRPPQEGPPPVFVQRPDDQPYIPPMRPYELSELARDLVLLARYMLRPRGRLVFFLPTITEDYKEVDVQGMLCEGMELVANSLQDYGSWGRRLITVRKTTTEKYPPPTFDPAHAVTDNVAAHVPAHKDFREKYFQGFKKNQQDGTANEQ